ncbi:hypothetical protein PS627_01281 [Pseudomonas fluorescens]|uniref:hypothetical protein n=1 Tax=Pseudomonas fluorescens TaxID=294 RepID=UPI0012519D38|nr:hypothetical protein [Pseudomonas fluorescens]CAG8865377.1 hypothetical protein PS627_01281 [Pseudomonas fluorescens]VVP66887.1 hypothetical protein PS910_00093 [Pseudomonas fluorescens]
MHANPDRSTPGTTNPSRTLQGLVWNIDLTLQDDSNQAAQERRKAIEQARASRPRTAQIEREIMIAVIVLYALILGSFAGLHLYGEYALTPHAAPTEVFSTGLEP